MRRRYWLILNSGCLARLKAQATHRLHDIVRHMGARRIEQRRVAQLQNPSGRVLVGTSAVTLVFALSRWGTNIGISPIYVTDVLLVLGILAALMATHLKGKSPITGFVPRSHPTPLFGVFLAYIVLRFIVSLGNGPFLDWARDGVPFLYAIVAYVSARSLSTSTAQARIRTMKFFWAALIVHMIWVSVSIATGNQAGFQVPLPIFGAPIFQLRPDIDAAIIAILVGMCFHQAMSGSHRIIAVIGVVIGAAAVLSMGTRAGLISIVLALGTSFAITYASSHKMGRRRTAMVLLVPALLLVGAIVLPQTTPGQRLLATIDPSQSGTTAQQNAQGTQRARELTWAKVTDWTEENGARQLFGGGFGNDFLEQSGSLAYLEGTTYTNVRSPHNWFIGIYARMGLVGVILISVVLTQLLAIVVKNRSRIGQDSLLLVATLSVAAILPVATLGVVLEAPFGAVPFFWSLGILMTLAGGRPSTPRTKATNLPFASRRVNLRE
jgi:hypothetical protein